MKATVYVVLTESVSQEAQSSCEVLLGRPHLSGGGCDQHAHLHSRWA